MKKTEQILEQAPLGKRSSYVNTYTPSLLFPVPRQPKRDEIGIEPGKLPFRGFDLWNGFEISWLNPKGKPMIALSEVIFPCESPYLAESKSQKLYLNSFNNSKFESMEEVRFTLEKDLSQACGMPVQVKLFKINEINLQIGTLGGICLDDLDIECSKYQPDPSTLRTSTDIVEETLHTNLLKSNCLVTGQPDWGSIEISYKGPKMDRAGLLQYIVSLRDHNEFHEQCVERVFCDLNQVCKPEWLTVYARYTRRGGLDINPLRTNRDSIPQVKNLRLARQ